MASSIPWLPGLPGSDRHSALREALKPSTCDLLAGHAARRRASGVDQAAQSILTAFQLSEHGPDFLFYWYWLVRQAGEHAALWGAVGLSPTQFLAVFAAAPLLVLHRDSADWRQGEGLLMVCWLDEVVPNLRARVHYWFPPTLRHPHVTLPLASRMLEVLFSEYHLLEGRTPVTNPLALRFVRRLGFTIIGRLPHAEWLWTAEGEKRAVAVVLSMMTRGMWKEQGWRP